VKDGGPRKPFETSARGRGARILLANDYLANDYAELGRVEDASRELNLALTLRANEASILYNAACAYCGLERKMEAMDALRKAWGFRDSVWASSIRSVQTGVR
jgi:Flp pilus assembly protein TadD